jgi:NADPH-dependent curcumin reductase CurA
MTKASGRTVERLVNKYNLHPTAFVGVLGMPSFTAYW